MSRGSHKAYGTKEYWVWSTMIQRCLNPKNKGYSNYGGRGIAVSDGWRDFSTFINDMGPRPFGMMLDRIDNNLGYCKENCRWATRREQNLNTRKNVRYDFNGEMLTIDELSRMTSVKYSTLYHRLKVQKLDVITAMELPPMKNQFCIRKSLS